MKLSDYVIDFLAALGIRHAFVVSGGASIHLLHSLYNRPGIEPVCPHHEQAGAMAADAYARVTANLGCAIGTSGPGATNMITGIAGAWFDSVPVLYVSGQVTTFRLKGTSGVRQFGFQETDIIPMVEPITKYCVQLRTADQIRYELEKAVHFARSGRPGPVLVDIPDDLQRAEIDADSLQSYMPADDISPPVPESAEIDAVLRMLASAERPVLIYGAGIQRAGALADAKRLAESLAVPVLTTWGAKDLLPGAHPLNAGTFGTHGTRAGNFTMQNADAVLAIGARLSTRETGSPLKDWARGAEVAVVDIDPAELRKFALFDRPVDHPICADAGVAVRALLARNDVKTRDLGPWQVRIAQWRSDYPATPEDAGETVDVHPYALMGALSDAVADETHIFTDTGCSVAWLNQAFAVKGGCKIHHDYNNTAMGWGLPAAIAGALALGRPTVCLTGDGSLMMNVQELATVAHHRLPVKLIILDNRGYAMVRQTEDQWLDGQNVGTSESSGLGFPDWVSLLQSFGLPAHTVARNADVPDALHRLFTTEGPAALHVEIGTEQRVVPQVAFGYGLEDSEPHLPREEFLAQMIVEPLPRSLSPTDPARTLPPRAQRMPQGGAS